MGNTLKVKTAGRYGARYGVGIRKKLLKIESKQRKYYQCPFCGAERVRRKAPGLYSCRKCSNTFTGGAFLPVTLPGSIVQKMVAQRSFLPSMKELLSAKEEGAEEEAATESGAGGKKEWGERASREIYRERKEWREHGKGRRDFFGQGKERRDWREQGKEKREWKERKPEEKEIGSEKKELREHEEKEIGLGKEKIEGHKREEKEIGKERKGKIAPRERKERRIEKETKGKEKAKEKKEERKKK